MIALRTGELVYLGWRLLADDPAGRVFNVCSAGAAALKLKRRWRPAPNSTAARPAQRMVDHLRRPPRGGNRSKSDIMGRVELSAIPVQPLCQLKDETRRFKVNLGLATDSTSNQNWRRTHPGTAAFSPDTYRSRRISTAPSSGEKTRLEHGWASGGHPTSSRISTATGRPGRAENRAVCRHARPRWSRRRAARGCHRRYCSILDGMTGEITRSTGWSAATSATGATVRQSRQPQPNRPRLARRQDPQPSRVLRHLHADGRRRVQFQEPQS